MPFLKRLTPNYYHYYALKDKAVILRQHPGIMNEDCFCCSAPSEIPHDTSTHDRLTAAPLRTDQTSRRAHCRENATALGAVAVAVDGCTRELMLTAMFHALVGIVIWLCGQDTLKSIGGPVSTIDLCRALFPSSQWDSMNGAPIHHQTPRCRDCFHPKRLTTP